MEPRITIITLGVTDLERSYRFYHEGLGFPTSRKPDQGIIFFQTNGVCLALYPLEELAKDVSPEQSSQRGAFAGITLAHNTRVKEDVDRIHGICHQYVCKCCHRQGARLCRGWAETR